MVSQTICITHQLQYIYALSINVSQAILIRENTVGPFDSCSVYFLKLEEPATSRLPTTPHPPLKKLVMNVNLQMLASYNLVIYIVKILFLE